MKEEADRLYDFMLTLPWAYHQPFMMRVSFGPQMKPIPRDGRSGNTNTQRPPYPQILLNLKEKIQTLYNCRFNSVECHLHQNEHAEVGVHRDKQPGYIAMVSLGQPRRFTVEERIYTLTHGSLLTFFGNVRHSMPRETHPCTRRISLIFRFVPKWLAKNGVGRTPGQKKLDMAEYEVVQPFLEKPGIEESALFGDLMKK